MFIISREGGRMTKEWNPNEKFVESLHYKVNVKPLNNFRDSFIHLGKERDYQSLEEVVSWVR